MKHCFKICNLSAALVLLLVTSAFAQNANQSTEKKENQRRVKAIALSRSNSEATDGNGSATVTATTSDDANDTKSIRKTKTIHVNKDGTKTTVVSKSGDEVSDAEIENLLNDDGASKDGTKKKRKVIIIERDETTEINGDGDKQIVVESTDDIPNANTKATVLKFNENGKSCTLKMSCDSTAKGKSFSLHLDGMCAQLQKHLDEGIKGLDEKTMGKIDEVLKRLSIDLSMPDSLVHLSFNGVETKDGANADLKVFVSKDASVTEPEEMTLNAEATSVNGEGKSKTIVKKVYVIRLKQDGVEKNTKVTTERSANEDALSLNDFALTPNPAQDGKFTLKFSLKDLGSTNVRISDINGKEVYTESLGDFKGSYEKPFDLSAFGKGVYLVNVSQGQKVAVLKVVIE